MKDGGERTKMRDAHDAAHNCTQRSKRWGRMPMQHYEQKLLSAPQAEEEEAEQLNVGGRNPRFGGE